MKHEIGVRHLIVLVALTLVLTGCVSQQNVKVAYYELQYAPPVVNQAEALDTVVGLRSFSIGSAYDHDRLVQKESDNKVTQSYYHRWVSNPRRMLSDSLLRDLQTANHYKAVVRIPAEIVPNYEITGYIQEISKDNAGPQPKVTIALEITLLRNSEEATLDRVVFQKSYFGQAPCPDSSAVGVAKAMSQAYRELSADIQSDIFNGIK